MESLSRFIDAHPVATFGLFLLAFCTLGSLMNVLEKLVSRWTR